MMNCTARITRRITLQTSFQRVFMTSHASRIIKQVPAYGTNFCKIELHKLSGTAIDMFGPNDLNQNVLGIQFLNKALSKSARGLTV